MIANYSGMHKSHVHLKSISSIVIVDTYSSPIRFVPSGSPLVNDINSSRSNGGHR